MVDIPGTPRTDPPPPTGGPARRKRGKGVLWAVLAVVIAFAVGFLWQWFEAGQVRGELTRTEQELAVARLRVQLAQAAMAAQAGDFETARSGMSEFFTRLQDQHGRLPGTLATEADRILGQRDDIITGLSRANPAYADVLTRTAERFGAAASPGAGSARPPAPAGTVEAPGGEPPGADSPAPGSAGSPGVGPGADTGAGAPTGDSGG